MSEAPNLNHLATRTLVRALADLGVRHAAVTPGSRNTPVAWQIAEEPRIRTWMHHDERSASFFAVGIGKATGIPALLSCTSGTAAAEYLPAVVEAHHSRTPLIVLTADRPPELQGIGAPQAIDQTGLYGTAVRWFHDPGVPELSERHMRELVAMAVEAWTASVTAPFGPVHLNLPFRDPLAPTRQPIPPLDIPATPTVDIQVQEPATDDLGRLEKHLSGRRVMVVAGPGPLPPQVAALGGRHGWPVVADPLSNLRGLGRACIEYGNAIARLGLLDGYLEPEAVLRFGGLPTSKALMEWIDRRVDLPRFVIHDGLWRIPEGLTGLVADPARISEALAIEPAREAWLARWRAVRASIQTEFQTHVFPSEPRVARLMGVVQRDGDDLWVGSSMPVRDIDDFFGEAGGRVFGHRGANGIDGLISSATGSALVSGRRTRVLSGDLSVIHDMTALGSAVRHGAELDIVVVDNDGGGIFHFLPQADHADRFEQLLGTPHGLDLVAIASAFGATACRVTTEGELLRALQDPPLGVRVFVVKTDRDENAALHRELWARLERSFA